MIVTLFGSFAGPDAVKYIVNHADVQAIFCVTSTLNTVSLSSLCSFTRDPMINPLNLLMNTSH